MTQILTTTPLFQHQQDAADFIMRRGGIGALFMDMGTGKTRAALEIFSMLRNVNPGLKMIVVCPLSLIESAWADDIRRFTGFSYFNMHGKAMPRDLREDILLINFESLILKRNSNINSITKGNLLVIDESSKLKNHKSKITKTVLFLKNYAKYRLIMSGTPAPNSPLEYWAQMLFLDGGVFNKSFFAFRNYYFHLARGSQRMHMHGQIMTRDMTRDIMRKGWKYEITKENLAKLTARMDHLVFRARKEECLDLPEQLDEVRKVEISGEQRRIYKEMKHDLIAKIKGAFVTAPVALTKLMKLREIASGFAINEDGDDVDIGVSAKLSELDAVLEELGNQQVIFWTNFKWENQKIQEMLKVKGKTFSTLYSQTKHKDESIQFFKEGVSQYLIANTRSAAHGLTFINCSTQVFFSLDYSLEYYEQAKARIHRAGQTKKCTYIHLVAKDTIDEQIYRTLQSKGDVNRIVEEYLR